MTDTDTRAPALPATWRDVPRIRTRKADRRRVRTEFLTWVREHWGYSHADHAGWMLLMLETNHPAAYAAIERLLISTGEPAYGHLLDTALRHDDGLSAPFLAPLSDVLVWFLPARGHEQETRPEPGPSVPAYRGRCACGWAADELDPDRTGAEARFIEHKRGVMAAASAQG